MFGTTDNLSDNKKSSNAITVIKKSPAKFSRKRRSSLMACTEGGLGAFALTPVQKATGQSQSPSRSTVRPNETFLPRKRSRPRKLDPLAVGRGALRPSSLLMINAWKGDFHGEDIAHSDTDIPSKKDEIEASFNSNRDKSKYPCRIVPLRNRCNPPREYQDKSIRIRNIIVESSSESSPDEIDPEDSLEMYGGCGKDVRARPAQSKVANSTNEREETPPIKTRLESRRLKRSNGNDTFQCSLTPIFEADRPTKTVVTPSPKKESKKKILEFSLSKSLTSSSKAVGMAMNSFAPSSTHSSKGHKIPTDAIVVHNSKSNSSSSISTKESNDIPSRKFTKRQRLKRVSKLRINSKKKQKVVLTRAMTVGRKTIPGRKVDQTAEEVDKMKIPLNISKSQDGMASLRKNKENVVSGKKCLPKFNARRSKRIRLLEKIVPSSREKSKPVLESIIDDDDSATQYSSPIPTKSKTLDPILDSRNNKDPKTDGSDEETSSSSLDKSGFLISAKKKALIGYIDQMMVDLRGLQTKIRNSKDNDMVSAKYLRGGEFNPLAECDIFISKLRNHCHIGTSLTGHQNTNPQGSSAPYDRDSVLTSLGKTHTTPQPIGLVPNQFFHEVWEEESECSYESVIDLGIVSDSRALVRYANENKASGFYGDDESFEDAVSNEKETLKAKSVPRKSRSSGLNTSCSVLLSLGGKVDAGSSDEVTKTSNLKLSGNLEQNNVDAVTPMISSSKALKKSLTKEKVTGVVAAIKKTVNPIESLLGFDWDEELDEELEKRAAERKEVANDKPDNDDMSSSDHSYLDITMTEAPTLVF